MAARLDVVDVYDSLKVCHQWAAGAVVQPKSNGRISSIHESIRQNQGSSLQVAFKSSGTVSSQNNSNTIPHKQVIESRRTIASIKQPDQEQSSDSVDDDFVFLEDEVAKFYHYPNVGIVQIDTKTVFEHLQKRMGSHVSTFDINKHIECYESDDTGASLESGTVDKSCNFSNTREITASENSWSVYLANAASTLIGNACGYFFSKKGTV